MNRAIAHLNIVGFRAAVAALEDTALRGRPYVIAGGSGGRVLAWDVSPEALRQNIRPGMALALAERMAKDLTVIPPNPGACQKANTVLEKVITRYAPAWQNDGRGNLFLDISGTGKLFGPPANCICHIQNEIFDSLGIRAAAATASNKLVSKVASRAIRPLGFIEVRSGDEAAFLAHQDIALLPGLGPSLLKTIRVTGFREAGELAALSDSEAVSLFGSKGPLLRNAALGIDNDPVAGSGQRRIEKKAEFPEEVLDEEIIRGAVAVLAEQGGLEMRSEKLGMSRFRLEVMYSDCVEVQGFQKSKQVLVTDNEILAAVYALFRKIVTRRIRIRSIILGFEDFSPLGYQPDLFEPENRTKNKSFQESIDTIRTRYGPGALTRGLVLAGRSGEKTGA